MSNDPPEVSIRIVDDSQPSDQTTVDAANIDQFNDIKDEQAKKLYEDRAFVAYLMSLPVGRRFMWGLLMPLHPFETVFSGGERDERAVWYHHALQQHGMGLYQKLLTAHRTEVALMHQENDVRLQPPIVEKKKRRSKANG